MRLIFSAQSWSEYLFWQEHDRKILRRINDLIQETMRTPFGGMGRPEPLIGDMKGFGSRRITQEHRLVYRVTGRGNDQTLEIAACRFHYGR
ncbi:MAG: Txe/YoeB family addiction module toxin [Rhizobiaceae bacterium]